MSWQYEVAVESVERREIVGSQGIRHEALQYTLSPPKLSLARLSVIMLTTWATSALVYASSPCRFDNKEHLSYSERICCTAVHNG